MRRRDLRQQLIQTTIDLSTLIGVHQVSVTQVCAVAGVSRKSFYNHFADVADVVVEACRQMDAQLRAAIQGAHDGASDAGERPRACVEALVAFVREDPVRADALLVQSHAGGPDVAQLRLDRMQWLVGLLREAAPGPDHGPVDEDLLAEIAVGGVGQVVAGRVKAGDLDALPDMVPALVDTLVPPSPERPSRPRKRTRGSRIVPA